ncbi:hypothetical protein C8R44DRAFT_750506 [Mycena epipterygia]|nr:hypothetical protein C8R44DRAFT_750506 [Mycena epipterygia]
MNHIRVGLGLSREPASPRSNILFVAGAFVVGDQLRSEINKLIRMSKRVSQPIGSPATATSSAASMRAGAASVRVNTAPVGWNWSNVEGGNEVQVGRKKEKSPETKNENTPQLLAGQKGVRECSQKCKKKNKGQGE